MRVAVLVAFVALAGTAATTAPAATAPPCGARDLRVSGMLNGAAGTMDGMLRVRNVSSTRCTVGAVPRVQLGFHRGQALPIRERTTSPYRSPVSTVAPHRRVAFVIDWANWCGSWPGPVGSLQKLFVQIRLTTGATLVGQIRSGRPRCVSAKERSRLFVTRFVPA